MIEKRSLPEHITAIAVVIVAAAGGAGVVLGGADDSPGLQMIGVVLVVCALVANIRSTRSGRGRWRAR